MTMFEKLCGIATYLPALILVLTTIVFVHEMGHFLVARANGVKVRTFSIGFGPELFGWTDKKGTRWRLSWLPFGGYVMMLGDDDATSVKANLKGLNEKEKSQTLTSKTPFQRMLVSFGGPLFNFLFTLLIFAGMGLIKGIPDMVPRVGAVSEGSLAAQAGLKKGDIIRSLNGEFLATVSEMRAALEKHAGQDVILSFERDGDLQEVLLPLYRVDDSGQKRPVTQLGVALRGAFLFQKATLGQSFLYGANYCWMSVKGLTNALTGIFSRQKDGAKLGSIFTIGKEAKQTLDQGWWSFMSFAAMLSLSLGFFNLLPIPTLDGGSIFLNASEIVLRRPLSEAFITWAYRIGMTCVGILMAWALLNDFDNVPFVKHLKDTLTSWKKFF